MRNLIVVLQTPDPTQLKEVQKMVDMVQHINQLENETNHTMERMSPPKKYRKMIDLSEEEYACRQYTTAILYGTEKIILFLYPIDELGEVVSNEIPIVSGFLDKAAKPWEV